MRKIILLLPLLGCQPEYGELQPQYEQLQEVEVQAGHIRTTQRKQRADIEKLQAEIDAFAKEIEQIGVQTEATSKAAMREIERTRASFGQIEKQVEIERNELRKMRRAVEQKEARVRSQAN